MNSRQNSKKGKNQWKVEILYNDKVYIHQDNMTIQGLYAPSNIASIYRQNYMEQQKNSVICEISVTDRISRKDIGMDTEDLKYSIDLI